MKKISLLLVILTTTLFAELTPKQVKTCKAAYDYGKQYDLGNTLAGIAYVESKCGLYKIGYTQDYGVTQVHLPSFLKEIGIKNNHMNRSKYATRLVTDDQYAFQIAIEELLFWKLKANRSQWLYYVSSYNQGSVVQNLDYAIKVSKAITELKEMGVLPK